jgi:hypothetical protein
MPSLEKGAPPEVVGEGRVAAIENTSRFREVVRYFLIFVCLGGCGRG